MRIFTTPKGTELPIADLKGKEYLQVQWRLVWFREEHPQWSIETDFLNITDKSATAKAVIKDQNGRILATAHKSQAAASFPNFIEKAETGAVGRALAYVGFGTQFCGDELEEGDELADSPTVLPKGKQTSNPNPPVSIVGNAGPLLCDCGNAMGVSRFNPNEWYCGKCRNKKPRTG